MKKIALLGSTGSIGKNTLKVTQHLENVEVVALAAHSNIDLLERQAKEFNVEIVAVFDKENALELQKRSSSLRVVAGMEGLIEIATMPSINMLVTALVGSAGLRPTIEAIKAKKDIALANKETLVAGGELVMRLAKENNVNILPVDSEHCAIFQCLQGENSQSVEKIILTASGGPFRTFPKDKLAKVTVEDALNHPTWNMGAKITIDSSTLMNKGLEIIEAHHLFNIPPEQIDVVIHPQSIIHSMVQFVDKSIMAQMGEPSMILPIQYAITYPNRQKSLLQSFNFFENDKLEFFKPDRDRFPCMFLAYDALKAGGSMPCYMNAANEVLVNRFLNKEISWQAIGQNLEKLMQKHTVQHNLDLETILEVDKQARLDANAFLTNSHKTLTYCSPIFYKIL